VRVRTRRSYAEFLGPSPPGAARRAAGAQPPLNLTESARDREP
jgi:hypothetical protein